MESPQSEALRAEFARLARDADWLHDVASAIADAIHAELNVDADIRPRTEATAESVVRLFAAMLQRDEPTDAAQLPAESLDYVREFVMRGVALEGMVRAYHIGHAVFFERWAAALRERVADPAVLADVIEDGAILTFRYLQTLTRDLIDRYGEERERWVRDAASMRAETVRALLAGEDVGLAGASRRLQYELDRTHVAFVVWTDADDDETRLGALERQAAALAGSGRALLVPLGGRLVAGWVAAAGARGVEQPALAAFGVPGAGVDGFCRSHRQAMEARRVARLASARPGTVTRFADVAITALASADERAAAEFVAGELGALTRDDDNTRRLAATLRAYLEEHASPRRTARRLGVHENTISNRVRAIEELIGRPADERVAETLLALRLARLVSDPAPRTEARVRGASARR